MCLALGTCSWYHTCSWNRTCNSTEDVHGLTQVRNVSLHALTKCQVSPSDDVPRAR